MYLIYLDESGTPSFSDPDPHYSIGGLMICENDWNQIDEQVECIRTAYSLREIHIRKLYNKNKKNILANPFCLPSRIIRDVYKLISISNLTLFCVSIKKKKNRDPEFLAWELLVERLNMEVDKKTKSNKTKEFSLIIMDQKNYSKDIRIKNYIKSLRLNPKGTGYQKIDKIIEDPVFTHSYWRNLTQLADAVVTCSRYHVEGEPYFSSHFSIIKDKFAKNSEGSIQGAGLKIWT